MVEAASTVSVRQNCVLPQPEGPTIWQRNVICGQHDKRGDEDQGKKRSVIYLRDRRTRQTSAQQLIQRVQPRLQESGLCRIRVRRMIHIANLHHAYCQWQHDTHVGGGGGDPSGDAPDDVVDSSGVPIAELDEL
ncbi:hypothetical protein BC938DRAFT_479328 [Jimgerdemannia flammicorona]|uniref:Uncharacterized protein n=1 Tax=Jimgerdemannia flammicorona TaxID=994334 RepID=A0A433QL43_9FUNG|nr:hypothetical protein BC938DRAFT_479328 [Jimgerdemannia flammicorona]